MSEAARAAQLLTYLTKPMSREGNEKPEYLLHPKLVRQAKALQFVFTRKAGLVVGVSSGHGFTITKSGTFGGYTSWSAPCFLAATSVSLGATLGKQETSAVSLALSDRAAEWLAAHGSTGARVAAEASLTLSERWPTASAALDSLLLEDVVSVGLSDGLLVDLSAAAGALKVDGERNAAAYGGGATPREILGGGGGPVPAPPEFGDLYDAINEIVTSAN